ncbi:protein MpGH28.6 [Marchantia polymorpha subsp. ruderalis]|uniref:Pectate lyase superfamily protein domain-containing protein n=2 Tax=Marchantia polymorpha TaxID=3197 RepID=A0AAF6BSB1_MARPO|nr:hypothetical protein MARPO_0056s0050 [Marchantia polymorpha]BBN14895.1 hypothetical protein Mp_6g15380 [Marchantia polymorpha subsp. ruderalis]|eukprot:PTQ37579.1 hypothetical protein MARPO_0056s0050 [Marchantia polymorpha]
MGRTIVLLLLIALCPGIGLVRSARIECLVAGDATAARDRPARGSELEMPGHLVESRRNCNVVDYGAKGNGEDFDTAAMQEAIDDCACWGGGGRVHVPPGNYLTATLFLRSNIELYVERGATIYGSPAQSDYPASSSRWYVLLAEGVHNVQITGGGTVDGQADKFVVREDPKKNVMVSWNTTGDCAGDECRPRLIGFLDSTNFQLRDLYLHQPAYWCLHIVRCNEVLVENVTIYGDFNTPNNDGIDIEDTNNTRIVGCHIDTGDDAICPKTYAGPLYNLTVTDCWIRTKSSAVKFGSATFHDFHGLRFERLTIKDSHRGLAFQLRDGGSISDVVFANIEMSTRYYHPSWWGRAEPIYMTACPRDSETVVGSISDVHFINISSTSENGVFISGSAGSILTGVVFQNVSLNFTNADGVDTETFHDYRPGCRGLVPHASSGLFMEYASNLTFRDVTLRWAPNVKWDTPFEFTPKTVGRLNILNVLSDTDSHGLPV